MDAWLCPACGVVQAAVIGAASPARAAAEGVAAVPGVADCECGHPRRAHGEAGCGAQIDTGFCPCSEFRLAGSKVAAMAGSCYVCGRRDHATGACPYFPHKTPGRKP